MSEAALVPVMHKFSLPVPMGSIQAYIDTVNRIPLLTPDEEVTLANRWHEHQDIQAAQRMVLAHLRLVVRVARTYLGYGLALSDLIQEGNIGLMKAVKRFDPAVGVRLVTFALHWIKAEINEFVIRNWRIVKIATTKAQRKLFFKLRSVKQKLGFEQASAKESAQIAKTLNVSTAIVDEMQQRLSQQDTDLEVVYDMADHLADPARQVENECSDVDHKGRLLDALEALDERSRDILQQRWLPAEDNQKMTLRELADKYQISIERIRQLEKNALNKLRMAFTEAGQDSQIV